MHLSTSIPQSTTIRKWSNKHIERSKAIDYSLKLPIHYSKSPKSSEITNKFWVVFSRARLFCKYVVCARFVLFLFLYPEFAFKLVGTG